MHVSISSVSVRDEFHLFQTPSVGWLVGCLVAWLTGYDGDDLVTMAGDDDDYDDGDDDDDDDDDDNGKDDDDDDDDGDDLVTMVLAMTMTIEKRVVKICISPMAIRTQKGIRLALG